MSREEGTKRVIVIGIGNEFRGDDAFGFEVIRRIREQIPGSVDVLLTEGDGTHLMQRWAGCDAVYIVDCITSGAPGGTCFRLDAAERKMPTQFFRSSSHIFGVAEAIEMSRALNQLPSKVIVYGAEGTQLDLGKPMSEPMVKAVRTIGDQLLQELRQEPT